MMKKIIAILMCLLVITACTKSSDLEDMKEKLINEEIVEVKVVNKIGSEDFHFTTVVNQEHYEELKEALQTFEGKSISKKDMELIAGGSYDIGINLGNENYVNIENVGNVYLLINDAPYKIEDDSIAKLGKWIDTIRTEYYLQNNDNN